LLRSSVGQSAHKTRDPQNQTSALCAMKTPDQFNDSSSLSRRSWIRSGLVTCSYLAAGGLALGQSEEKPAPKGYTPPGPVTNLGRAPGLQTRLTGEHPSGERTYAVVFAKGDEIMSGLTEFAVREKLVAGHFTAIGALESARFGWFDRAQKAYRDIPIDQQVEMISLIGDLGVVNGAPQIHAHGAVGFRDGQLRGGHILEAIVWPTLELFFTAYRTPLIKAHDAETNLSLFDLKENKDGSNP
jgi:predicted DNA-binding protein with PD1-like motif